MTWEEELDLKAHVIRIGERQIAMRREGWLVFAGVGIVLGFMVQQHFKLDDRVDNHIDGHCAMHSDDNHALTTVIK